MINFAVGLGIGLTVAILVYRTNKSKMGEMASKINKLQKELAKNMYRCARRILKNPPLSGIDF